MATTAILGEPKILERYDEALTDFDQAIERSPDFVESWYLKASLLNELKQFQAALTAYEQALLLQPDRTDIWWDKSYVLFELKEYEAGFQAIQTAKLLAPQNPDYQFTYALFAKMTHRYDEAIHASQTALKLESIPANRVPIYDNLGDIFTGIKRYQSALAAYEAALAIDPNQANIWYYRARLLDGMGRFEGAISSYQKVLELNPDHPTIHRDCAWENMHLNRMTQAQQLFEQAIAQHPQDAEAHYGLASCYGWQRQASNAMVWLQKAVILDSQYGYQAQTDGAFADLILQDSAFRQFLRGLKTD